MSTPAKPKHGRRAIMVSNESGQVAIASGIFVVQYYCYVSRYPGAVLSRCDFVLQSFVPASGAYRRGTGPASRK